MQAPEPLCPKRYVHVGDASCVATWLIKTPDKTGLDRIGTGNEYDRDGRGRGFDDTCRFRAFGCGNDAHPTADQIGCQLREPVIVVLAPAVFDRYVTTLDVASLAQPLAKCRHEIFTNEEDGLVLRHYWTNACRTCALKAQCTKGPQRRIKRWDHEYVVDAVQARLDKNPDAMRTRRETVEHPFGTLKMRMGATHFLMKTLPKVATEMALHVLAYNLTRVMNIVGIRPLLAAIRA